MLVDLHECFAEQVKDPIKVHNLRRLEWCSRLRHLDPLQCACMSELPNRKWYQPQRYFPMCQCDL